MAENNPESTPKVTIFNARGEEMTTRSVTPRQVKRSLRKKVAYGVAAVGAAATMIAGGIAIEKTGKFPLGATGGEAPAASAVGREIPPSSLQDIAPATARKKAIAAAEIRAAEAEEKAADERLIQAAEERIKRAQEAPKAPAPTETPTDQQKKDARVAESLGKEMARLQFEYDKAHPTPVIPTVAPASRGKPGQGSEGESAPLGGFLFGSAITAAVLGVAYKFRTQGGRLVTAIRNRFGGGGAGTP